jgi:hypothetical protein
MSKPFDINEEIDQLSEKMVKAQKITFFELASELGLEGLKKASSKMSEAQLTAFKEELQKHIPKSVTKSDSTPDGMSEEMAGVSMAPRDENETEQKKEEREKAAKRVEDAEGLNKDENALGEMLMASEKAPMKKSEGARGGHVIGHTKSGKPIYASGDGQSYWKTFNSDEHLTAAAIHAKEADKYKKNVNEIRAKYKENEAPMSDQDQRLHSYNWNKWDHHHHEAQQHQEIGRVLRDREERKKKTLEKSKGARGGHVIGYTQSGKPIYEAANHSSHKDFSKKDHADALQAHKELTPTAGNLKALMEAKYHAEQQKTHLNAMENNKMKKSVVEKSIINNTMSLEPFIETDRGGKFEMNMDDMNRQALLDELIAMDAMASEEMRDVLHQGGPEMSESWTGQTIDDPQPHMDYELGAEDLKTPKSENKNDQIADKIIELNKLGEMSHEERMEMREKIMMILEALMERQLEKAVISKALDTLSVKLNLPNGKLHTLYDKVVELKKSEGARGGKIIGHTKSGKPIYEHAEHKGHEGFHYEDHFDAMKVHHKLAHSHEDKAKGMIAADGMKDFKELKGHAEGIKHHLNEASKHEKMFRKMTPGIKKALDPFYDNIETNEDFYKSDALNPFEYRKIGQNYHADVDAYIEAEEKATKENLDKSTFFYPDQKALTKSSGIQELIEKGAHMDELELETALINKGISATYRGVNIVKSFTDSSMEDLFVQRDTWGQPIKKSYDDIHREGSGSAEDHDDVMHQDAGEAMEESGEPIRKDESEESDEEKKKREEAKEKLMEMEEREHATKDPEELIEAEKEEHMEKAEDDHKESDNCEDVDLEKCGGYDMLSKELDDMKEDAKDEEIEKAYIGFKKLESKIAHRGGVKNPAAVAASIGRKKYGKQGFAKLSAAGRRK